MTRHLSHVAVFIACLLLSINAAAEKTVYKWTDQNGVIHFSDERPTGVVGVETITTSDVSPFDSSPVPQPAAVERASAADGIDDTPADLPPLQSQPDIRSLSLEDLDRRCDEAREAMIAPLREQEIQQCKADSRNDPDGCERFNADFGEGGRTVDGDMRPRMFDDLSECADALQERNRRAR